MSPGAHSPPSGPKPARPRSQTLAAPAGPVDAEPVSWLREARAGSQPPCPHQSGGRDLPQSATSALSAPLSWTGAGQKGTRLQSGWLLWGDGAHQQLPGAWGPFSPGCGEQCPRTGLHGAAGGPTSETEGACPVLLTCVIQGWPLPSGASAPPREGTRPSDGGASASACAKSRVLTPEGLCCPLCAGLWLRPILGCPCGPFAEEVRLWPHTLEGSGLAWTLPASAPPIAFSGPLVAARPPPRLP